MHQAVELILARMKSHPDDFTYTNGLGSGKWNNILNSYSHLFTEEERKAIEDEFKNVHAYQRNREMDECVEAIYNVLTDDGNNEEDVLRFKTKGRYTQQILEDGLDTFFKEEYKIASRS